MCSLRSVIGRVFTAEARLNELPVKGKRRRHCRNELLVKGDPNRKHHRNDIIEMSFQLLNTTLL